jgi:hypothetical protein
MRNNLKNKELLDKIVKGMDLVYERLIANKREKNQELVIIKDGQIVRIKP